MGLFKKKSFDFESSIIGLSAPTVQLKEYAIDVCAGYVARAFSQSDFRIADKRWSYRFNVKPNINQSGAEFWYNVIYQLYKEGEALVILSDDNQLLLADTFDDSDYTLYSNKYKNVVVGDYVFNRVFDENDVFHFSLTNGNLKLFTASIYDDYQKIISNLFMSSKVSNQLRFKLKIEKNNMSKKSEKKDDSILQNYIDKISNSDIVGLPESSNITYEEISSPNKQALSTSLLDEGVWSFVDKVAIMIGIPPVLLHGDVAGSSDAQQIFNVNCLEPLNQLIEDEINSKIFTEQNFKKEQSLNIIGTNKPDLFNMASSVDKLISSGAFTRNEIRTLLGYDPEDGLDEFVITKNYQSNSEALKGGEKDE